jgi:hypothetical protein
MFIELSVFATACGFCLYRAVTGFPTTENRKVERYMILSGAAALLVWASVLGYKYL